MTVSLSVSDMNIVLSKQDLEVRVPCVKDLVKVFHEVKTRRLASHHLGLAA